MIREFDNNKTLVCAVYDAYKNDEHVDTSEIIYEVDKTMSYDDCFKAVLDDLKKRHPDCEIELWDIDEMRF